MEAHYTIKPPFYCSHGEHIFIGENFFCNFNCIFLDLNKIIIGDNVLIGSRVSIYTAGHPNNPLIRNTGLEYTLPVEIGNNAWIGGDVTINPGIHIGSGSVVTKDIPENVIAYGNPCRVQRCINDNDRQYWQAQYEDYLNDQ